jgi:hypothetical protein
MNRHEFSAIAGRVVEAVLGPTGFSRDRSAHCTFWRTTPNQVYHFILLDPLSRGVWYDVKVFPSSPLIDPLFERRFPDGLEIPTDRWCYLGAQGVGPDQELYHCKSEETFRQRFEKTVKSRLIDLAVPYLNALQTVADMVPMIKDDGFEALALCQIGRSDDARPLLERERERLTRLDQSNPENAIWLKRIDELLATT